MMIGVSILHEFVVTFWCLLAAFWRLFEAWDFPWTSYWQHFWAKAGFLLILGGLSGVFRGKCLVHFGSVFELFVIRFLIDFWRPFWEAVCVILGAKWLQNGRHLGVNFGVIF